MLKKIFYQGMIAALLPFTSLAQCPNAKRLAGSEVIGNPQEAIQHLKTVQYNGTAPYVFTPDELASYENAVENGETFVLPDGVPDIFHVEGEHLDMSNNTSLNPRAAQNGQLFLAFTNFNCAAPSYVAVSNFGCGGACHHLPVWAWSSLLQGPYDGSGNPTASLFNDIVCGGRYQSVGVGCTANHCGGYRAFFLYHNC